jgi:hypothetical protein
MRVKHPGLVIAGAIIVCLPMAPHLISGSITATTAATRFLIALVACWVFGGLLTWVIGTYSEQAAKTEVIRAIEEAQRAEGAEDEALPAGSGSQVTH